MPFEAMITRFAMQHFDNFAAIGQPISANSDEIGERRKQTLILVVKTWPFFGYVIPCPILASL